MKKLCGLLVLALLLCGCGQTASVPEDPEDQMPEAVEQTTGEPTEETTQETTGPAVLEPETARHCGIREDGSFDEGTLFIGDSLTYGMVTEYLPDNGFLGDARYMAVPGAALTAYFQGNPLGSAYTSGAAYTEEFDRLRMYEAVETAGDSVTAVYFMLGTNYSKYAGEDTYRKIVEHILESCPNATVFLQIVPLETSPKVNYQLATQWAGDVYTAFREAGCQRIFLIDTQTAIGKRLTHDGIHLTAEGQACWYQALVDFTRENEIPQ